MAMQSFGDCPWCGAHIELRKESKAYVCPVCACTFRWFYVATGVVLAVILILLKLLVVLMAKR